MHFMQCSFYLTEIWNELQKQEEGLFYDKAYCFFVLLYSIEIKKGYINVKQLKHCCTKIAQSHSINQPFST